MLRRIIAVLFGLLVALAIIFATETVLGQLYPLPSAVNLSDSEALTQAMMEMPAAAYLSVLLGWLSGAFVGGFIANRIDRRRGVSGLIVGSLLFLASIANMLMLPHPAWFWCSVLIIFPIVIYVVFWLERKNLSINIP